jgi:hypothetical protein
MSSSAPTSRIPVRTRMQGRLVRDPRGPVFAKLAHQVLADRLQSTRFEANPPLGLGGSDQPEPTRFAVGPVPTVGVAGMGALR